MTHYYWHKHINDDLKKSLHAAVDEGDIDKLYDLLSTTNPVHLGVSEYGWKFIWNPHDFKYYQPNVHAFLNWVKSADFISDDNCIKMTPEEFLNRIANDIYGKDLYDMQKYAAANGLSHNEYRQETIKRYGLLFNVSVNLWGEFYLGEFLFNIEDSESHE